MQWHGEFAFGEVWLAYRGASADNRFHAHAAVQLVAGTVLHGECRGQARRGAPFVIAGHGVFEENSFGIVSP